MTPRRAITEVELQGLRDMLARIRTQCSPEEHDCVAEFIETVAEMRTMLIEHDGDDDEPLDESFLEQAIKRARARLSR